MTEKRPIVLIAFVAGILLLAGNMFVQSRLDNSIRENKLIDEQFVEGAPPWRSRRLRSEGSAV